MRETQCDTLGSICYGPRMDPRSRTAAATAARLAKVVPTTQVVARLPADLVERIDLEASRAGDKTRTAAIVRLLRERLE